MIVAIATGVTTDADDAAIVAKISRRCSAIPVPLRVPRETETAMAALLLSKN
jgi:hypothetical protein